MRLDKYLKLTRLVKRRSVAKDLANLDKFLVNDKLAKPSKEINIGDKIDLYLGKHHIVIKVLNIKDYCLKEDSTSLYEVLLDEIIELKEE